MRTASSAMRTCSASASASEWTATVAIPILRAVLMTRQAISPRFAIRIFPNISALPTPPASDLRAGHVAAAAHVAGAAGQRVVGLAEPGQRVLGLALERRVGHERVLGPRGAGREQP